MSKGLYCRGRWISLEEDEDECWITSPVTIDAGVPRNCHNMQEVNAAAEVGLLFPDYDSAYTFLAETAQESSKLNEVIENADTQMEQEGSLYCPVCEHCGEIGCCGISGFFAHHLYGKTGCPYGDSILKEIEENYDEYRRTCEENANGVKVYMLGEMKRDRESGKEYIERHQERRGGHVYTRYKTALNQYKDILSYHPELKYKLKIWRLSGNLTDVTHEEMDD